MMERTERSLLIDAVVLYESIRELLPENDRKLWELWKQLTLEKLDEKNSPCV